LIRELRPVGLDELGLAAAIEHCVEGWRTRLAPARLSLAVDERIDRLDETTSLTLYRAVQEALTNCVRHSHANRVDVCIAWCDGHDRALPDVLLRVEDDGVGADLAATTSGLGLVGMRERLVALGGSLVVESSPRAGLRLVARVPAGRMEGA
jgi:two-component system, NarL family, sensor histidine kinase UhpB